MIAVTTDSVVFMVSEIFSSPSKIYPIREISVYIQISTPILWRLSLCIQKIIRKNPTEIIAGSKRSFFPKITKDKRYIRAEDIKLYPSPIDAPKTAVENIEGGIFIDAKVRYNKSKDKYLITFIKSRVFLFTKIF